MGLTLEKRKNLRNDEHFKKWNEKISGQVIGDRGVPMEEPRTLKSKDYANKVLSLDIEQEMYEDKNIYDKMTDSVQLEREEMVREISENKTHRYEKTRKGRMKDACKAAKSAMDLGTGISIKKYRNHNLSDYEELESNCKINRYQYEMNKNMAKAMARTQDEEDLLIENAKRAYLIKEIRELLAARNKDNLNFSEKNRKKINERIDERTKEYVKILLTTGEIEEERAQLYRLDPSLILDELGLKKEIEKNPDAILQERGEELGDYIHLADLGYMSEMSDEETLKNYDRLKKMYLSAKYAKNVADQCIDSKAVQTFMGYLSNDEKEKLYNNKFKYIEQMYKKAVYLKAGLNKTGKRFTALQGQMDVTLQEYNELQEPIVNYVIKSKNSEKLLNNTAQKIEKKYTLPGDIVGGKTVVLNREDIQRLYDENKKEKEKDPDRARAIAFKYRLENNNYYKLADGTKIIAKEPLFRGGIKQLLTREPFSLMSEKEVDGLMDKLCAGSFLPEKSKVEKDLSEGKIKPEEAEKLYKEIEEATRLNMEGISALLDGLESTFDNREAILGRDKMVSYEFISEHYNTILGMVSLDQVWERFTSSKVVMDMYEKKRGKENANRLKNQVHYYQQLGFVMANRANAAVKYPGEKGEEAFWNMENATINAFHDSNYEINQHRDAFLQYPVNTYNHTDPSVAEEKDYIEKQIKDGKLKPEVLKKNHFERLIRFNVDVYANMPDDELLLRYDELKNLAAMGRIFNAYNSLLTSGLDYGKNKPILKIRLEMIEALCARADLLSHGHNVLEPEVNATKIKLHKLCDRYGQHKTDILKQYRTVNIPKATDNIPKKLTTMYIKYHDIEKSWEEKKEYIDIENLYWEEKSKGDKADQRLLKEIEYAHFWKSYNYHFAGGGNKDSGYRNERVIREPIFRGGINTILGLPVFRDMPAEVVDKMMEGFSTGIFLPTYKEVDQMDKSQEEKEAILDEINRARKANTEALTTFLTYIDRYYDHVATVLGSDAPSPEFVLYHKDIFDSLASQGQVFTELLNNKDVRDLLGEKAEAAQIKAKFYHSIVIGAMTIIHALGRNNENYDPANDDFDYSSLRGSFYLEKTFGEDYYKNGVARQVKKRNELYS